MLSFLQNQLGRRSSNFPISTTTRSGSTLSTASHAESTLNASKVSSGAPSLTPATSNTDAASFSTDTTPKQENPERSCERLRHARPSLGSYNERILSGSTKRKTRRKTIDGINSTSAGDTVAEGCRSAQDQLLQESEQALNRDWELGPLPGDDLKLSDQGETGVKRRRSTRLDILEKTSDMVDKTSSMLGKRGRETVDAGMEKLKALKRDRRASLRPKEAESPGFGGPTPKKARFSESSKENGTPFRSEGKLFKQPTKRWLSQGLYVGQDRDFDARLTESKNNAKKNPRKQTNKQQQSALPLPMFAGERVLENGRNFRLPFNIFNPLPPGQPKPEEWKKTHKSMDLLMTACCVKLTDLNQTSLWVRPRTFGKRQSVWNPPNVSVLPKPAVANTVSIDLCSTSATLAIATLVLSIAPTVPSNPFANARKLAASITRALRCAKPLIVAMASARIVLLNLTRSLLSIPARSSPKRSVIAVCMAATKMPRYVTFLP